MAGVTEIAPDVYRISVYATQANLQFNHFLVKDDEPLLFHTGLRGMFPEVREALSTLVDPSRLRWISFSHFESDECGALQEWLAVAPRAEVVCSDLGAMVSVNDFIGKPAHAAPAAWLGRWRAVRGDAADTALFGSFPPERRR
jgi:flavorubredoxin